MHVVPFHLTEICVIEMLAFPDYYFNDEIRSGFNVPEMMKRCWAAHLKILEELKVLFDKYDLTYYADFGTLLGAIRHGGIIPWDDDVDISMPRADFMKLIEHADEIGGGLTIRSVYNTETFTNFHAVATHKVDTLKWDEKRMEEYYGCPFICYIDIFPMDYIPRDPEKKKLMKQLYSYSYQMVHDCVAVEQEFSGGMLISRSGLDELICGLQEDSRAGDISPNGQNSDKLVKFRNQLKELETFLARFYPGQISIDPEKSLRNQLCLAAEFIASSCSETEADRVDYCPHMAYLDNDISRAKEWVRTTRNISFEVTEIAVPTMYHEVLVSRFGENYMTPVKAPSTHEYPYYRTQVEVLIGGDTGEVCLENRNKKAFLEALGTFDEVHAALEQRLSVCRYGKGNGTNAEISEESAALVRSLLADLQDGAVGIGEAIEAVKGEGTDSVKKLEEYCEALYRIYLGVEPQSGQTEDSEAKTPDLEVEKGHLDKLLADIKRSVVREIHDEVPKEWKEKLFKAPKNADHNGRDEDNEAHNKVVIYGISAIQVLAHGELAPQKIKSSFSEFKEDCEDICVILLLPQGLPDFLDKCKLALAKSYREAISSFANAPFVICPEQAQLDLAISLADSYYGDECPLMERCKAAGIPTIIQDYELQSRQQII